MNSGECCAKLYSTSQSVRVRWQQGLICEVEAIPPARAAGRWLAPSLFDVQINGYAGVDFQGDALTDADLQRAVSSLHAAGCGRFLLTLMTDRWEIMLARLRHLRALRAGSPVLQASIAGWHLEGPFLSSAPGYCGAHPPDLMRDPGLADIHALREAAGGDLLLLTLAPERWGALESIALAVSLGMKVSLGHTNASAATLVQARAAGATGFTHLANACPQELDRHDNIVWRALDTPGLTYSLIPDGYHVSPALFRLAHRGVPGDALFYTTDAVSAAGAPPGRYTVGPHQVEVGPDAIVRQPGRTNFAGSGLSPIAGIHRAAEMLGCPWTAVWDFLSTRPAQFMGLSHAIAVGQPAHLCLLEVEQGRLSVGRTWVNGEEWPG